MIIFKWSLNIFDICYLYSIKYKITKGIIIRNKIDDVLCEIAKAAKIIEEKTDIKRDEFDKYTLE